MSNNNGNQNGVPNGMLGWLIAPLAVLVAIAANLIGDFGLNLDLDGMTPFVAIIVAAILGTAPRTIREKADIALPTQYISLLVLIVAIVASEGAAMLSGSNLVGLLFFITMFAGHILDTRGRHEWNTVMIFTMVGILFALIAAGDYASTGATYILEGQEIERTSAWQEAIGFVFFNMLTLMIVLGFLAAVLTRGVLTPESEDGWFGYISSFDGYYNKKTLPLQLALLVWAASHAAVLWYFFGSGDLNILAIYTDEAYTGYVGYWPALLTGVFALMVSWMCAERWYTRAMFLASMWILYLVSSLYEQGHWANDNFEGSWAVWIWFGITFAIGVVIYWFSTHDSYGGWMIRELHEPSAARVFWSNHWAGIMTFAAFLTALAIRIQWYAVPSMNSYGLDSWDMTGGSDPWYMKRVVDYIIAENAHLVFDADRNYPVGGINPRPPLFTWSIAILGMIIAPLASISTEEAVWWSILALPAIYGALTIFPMAAMARDNFGKGAGVISAWLIAFMPTHVQKSTWGMADHDSFVMLFMVAAFMFYLRAVKLGGDERLVRNVNASISSMLNAMGAVLRQRRAASANAIAAGVCFAIVALGWKGFVYGPAILFLAYSVQVAMNMFRRRDSTILSTLNILMLGTIFLMVIPFYGHPQLDLILNATGLQPLVFIGGFTVAITWITTGFRDKPWLLVLGSLFFGLGAFLGLLYVLQTMDISNAWNVLTTGSGYFSKDKIFGTIAEASAPSRGQLFASYGPIVFVLAIVMGVLALWDGFVKKNSPRLVLGMWVLIASYMAWSAGRFLFNAAPAMTIMGSWGIVALWGASGAGKMSKEWRRMGIRTPGERITNARRAVWRTPQFSAIGLILVLLVSQHATYGLDAAIPGSSRHEGNMDETLYNVIPDIMRWNDMGFSLLDDSEYDQDTGRWYLGSFGSGFNDQGWNLAYSWLDEQDQEMAYSERPAFVSWWDYGFQALETGSHPSVSDNFQSGIPASGNMLLARSQDDLVAMFVWRLSEGDLKYTGTGDHTGSFESTLGSHLTEAEYNEFIEIQTNLDSKMVEARSFEVIQTNQEVTMAEGTELSQGLLLDGDTVWKIYDSGDLVPCEPSEESPDDCQGEAFTDFSDANTTFNSRIRSTKDTQFDTTHYIFGDYWYTNDLIEEFDSVSTGLHRKNSGIALVTQLLLGALDSSQLNDLYADLMDNAVYTVQNYEGAPGETITRDHEIRYFAIDNRLYPRAGRYSSDYTGGNPSGIFAAPTILSGQDFNTFMIETYETRRGEFNDEMSREEFETEMQKDAINQASGAQIDPLQLVDIRIDHTDAFFETMLARAYVGYGASDLGFSTTEQPGQHFGQSGTPDSMMANALPLPGAMMNHFVIANWYDANDANKTISQANTLVKILKYYPGAEIGGSVTMSDDGQPLGDVRILIERDAFSGEDNTDLDPDTYWIPIGYTDADENGEWSYTVPAGRIRVSAYAGVFDDTAAKDIFRTGEYTETLADFLTDGNEERDTNLITSLLGKVANMTWIGESTNNISGPVANRDSTFTGSYDIEIDSSGVSGTVLWTGHESFNDLPLDNTTFILRNIWAMTDNYTLETTSGSFSSETSRIMQGTGEVNFDGDGRFESEGMAIVRDFTGTFARDIADERSYTSNGSWTGAGNIVATWINMTAADCLVEDNETVLPSYVDEDNNTIYDQICLTDEDNTYFFAGTVSANGRMTADGTVSLIKDLDNETFEGAGIFLGEGTANGTGLFIGAGDFSGDMVKPGSFFMTGLTPGTYNMIAVLENGKEVLLPDPLEVDVKPTFDLHMTIPGSIFEDTLYDGMGEILNDTVIELIDMGLGEESLITIITDENGSFSHGPLAKGDYMWRVDIDQDGWYEREVPLIVGDESTNLTLEVSIPTKRDLTIQLEAVDPLDPLNPLIDVANRTLMFTNVLSTDASPYVTNATSDENGQVYIEIDRGEWIVSDESDEQYVLWDEIEVTTEDLNLTMSYAESVWVNGTVYAVPENILESVGGVENMTQEMLSNHVASNILTVEARSGSIMMSDTTDMNGTYSLRLPGSRVFHITADAYINSESYNGGHLLLDANNGVPAIFLRETTVVRGSVWLDNAGENGTSWGEGVPGSEDAEVIATNSEGLEWRVELSVIGDFTISLQQDEWTFTISNEDMNVAPLTIEIFEETPIPLELIADPNPVNLTFHVFMDTSDDRVWENGTHVQLEFSLVPISTFGTQYNVTASDYNTQTGELNITLEVGEYSIVLPQMSPRDENATDYFLNGEYPLGLDLGLAGPGAPVEIILDAAWLTTGTVLEDDGITPMDNSSFWLRSADGEEFHMVTTDENGTFADYLPQGEWVVEVAPYDSSSSLNVTEIYRGMITLDENSSIRTDIELRTRPALVLDMQLQEALTGVNITATRITAVSQDGLGNVSLGPSDNFGMISEVLMPGAWTLSLDISNSIEQWTLAEGVYNFDASTAVNGTWDLGIVDVEKLVSIGGKVFWDLDADDIADSSEGISDVNVTIVGGSINETLVTDENGVWTLFAPIRTNYTIDVYKNGFAAASYMEGNETMYVVNDTHESRDIELVAGVVSVSGTVTDIAPQGRLENASVTLYPIIGIERDSVVAQTSFDNGTLTWTASAAPGDWIVVVSGTDVTDNGGGVAIGLLQASVQDGATLELVMKMGGRVIIDSSWSSFDNSAEYNAGDLDETVHVEIDLGDGIEWNADFDENGELDMVLPTGAVQLFSEFSNYQHEMELEMKYNAARNIDNQVGPDSKTLEFTRRTNSDMEIGLASIDSGATLGEGELDLNSISTEENGYEQIEVTLSMAYGGTEVTDVFTISGGVSGTQDQDLWVVEFYNSSSEEWVSTIDVSMGIGTNNSDEANILNESVLARFTLPLQNESNSYDEGHNLNIRMISGQGGLSEIGLTVFVEQQYGLTMSDSPDAIGVADGGQTLVTVDLFNEGNGDDSIVVVASLDEECTDWQVTPANSTITIASGNGRAQSFTVHAPVNSTVSSCDLVITADSEGTVEQLSTSTEVKVAVATLSFVQGQEKSDIAANEAGVISIMVQNTGFLTATNVIVYLEGQHGTDYPVEQVTIAVPAEGVATAVFDHDGFGTGTQRFKIYMTVIGTPVDSTGDDHEDTFEIEFFSIADDEKGGGVGYVVAVLGVLVLIGGYKTARKGSKARF